jgi:hypothetical protein
MTAAFPEILNRCRIAARCRIPLDKDNAPAEPMSDAVNDLGVENWTLDGERLTRQLCQEHGLIPSMKRTVEGERRLPVVHRE